MPPLVAIVIVNWNGEEDTLECLQSLAQDSYSNKLIIIIDNGSVNGQGEAIAAAFPAVTVVSTGSNLGFSGGSNVGIQYALEHGADYLYLLNNDTIVEPGSTQALVSAALSYPAFGLFTPVIHYYDRPHETWFAGSQIDIARGVAEHDNSRIPALAEPPIEIPWASGCAMFVRAGLLRDVDGLDERYFLNWEDVDLCLRLRAAGATIALVPAARVYHKVSRSLSHAGQTATYYYVRNNLLLTRVHTRGLQRMRAGLFVMGRSLRLSLRGLKRRDPGAWRAFLVTLRAFHDFLRSRFGKAEGLGCAL